jgi:hypothetical protein
MPRRRSLAPRRPSFAGIHVFVQPLNKQGVDGRDKPDKTDEWARWFNVTENPLQVRTA